MWTLGQSIRERYGSVVSSAYSPLGVDPPDSAIENLPRSAIARSAAGEVDNIGGFYCDGFGVGDDLYLAVVAVHE